MNSSPIGQEERKRLNFCSFMMLPEEPGLVASLDCYPSGYLTRFHLIAQSTVVAHVNPSITQAGALFRKHQRVSSERRFYGIDQERAHYDCCACNSAVLHQSICRVRVGTYQADRICHTRGYRRWRRSNG